MALKQLILNLSDAAGIAGQTEALAVAEKALSPLCPTERDDMGSLYATLDGGLEGSILLDAHIDEIGFIVTGITDEGFLKVAKCGGIDIRVLAGMEVWVHGKEKLAGIFCCMPPHLQKDESVPEIEKMVVDIGFSKERAQALVSLGDRVNFSVKSKALLGDLITGKSLDNRTGAASLIRTAELLKASGKSFPKVVFMLSTQEELGCQGAKVGAYSFSCDESIAVDVSFGVAFCTDKENKGVLGEGPMIGFSPVLSGDISDKLVNTAKDKGIPFQYEVMGGRTSTNADVIAVTKGGIKSGLVSIPLRYMHTPAEVVSVSDVENTAQLLAAYILSKGEEK